MQCFNSLLEMLAEVIERGEARIYYAFQFSIGDANTQRTCAKGGAKVVSILYWRCMATQIQTPNQTPKFSFNSLLEMRGHIPGPDPGQVDV